MPRCHHLDRLPQARRVHQGPAVPAGRDLREGGGVFGYSHGADLARLFVNRLGDVGLPVGTVTYSAYIDAIKRGRSDLLHPPSPQTLRPFFGDFEFTWHDNFYQDNEVLVHGAIVPRADQNYRMTDRNHSNIDEHPFVKAEIMQQIFAFVAV